MKFVKDKMRNDSLTVYLYFPHAGADLYKFWEGGERAWTGLCTNEKQEHNNN